MNPAPKRTRTIKVRVTDAELAGLRARAGDLELAAWLRAVGMGERPARRRPAMADPALLAALCRIGNNLNHLARLAGTTKQLPTLVALAGIKAKLLEVARCTSSS